MSGEREPLLEGATVIDLMEMTAGDHAYLIHPGDSNRFYYQQVAGALCSHRVMEGRAEAIGDMRFALDLAIIEAGCCGEVSAHEADQLDRLFQQNHMPYHVLRERLEDSTEAWVWVEAPSMEYRGFIHQAILTWENCD